MELLLEQLAPLALRCFVVNDGSDQTNTALLRDAARRFSFVTLLDRPLNEGKGAAVVAGFLAAAAAGHTHAVQIDADGQHRIEDIPRFLSLAAQLPTALVCGKPIFDQSAPRARLWGRKLSIGLSWLETCSTAIADILCGFRVYPLAACLELAQQHRIAPRMDFDTDIAVRLIWRGVPICNVETVVCYPRDGCSHFRLVRDNARLICLHLRLLAEWPLHLLAFGHGRQATLDAPAVTTSSRQWFQLQERGSLFWFRFILGFHRIFGPRLCKLLLYPVVLYFFLTGSAARAASQQYLRRVGLQPTLLLSFQHFVQFAQSTVDRVSA